MSHFGSATSLTRAAGKPAVLLAAAIAAVLGSCAKQHGQQEANAALPAPQPAYCEPRPVPNCGFKGSTLKTVDPAEFASLKQAYERRCIRHAEKAERERMRELHASGACVGRPAPSLATSR